jgi:cytoskeletal protein CcmA (bactofilin family)
MATVRSRSVIVSGTVTGNVFATEKIVLHKTARLEGDIEAGCVAIEEGAIVNGRITMSGIPKSSL